MKIGVIVINRLMTEEELEKRRAFLLEYAQKGTEVTMTKIENGPISIESSLEHEQAGCSMALKVQNLETEGYDAFIPWCGEDAGLVSSRESTRIPVIGPLQSSCSIAISLGHRLAIIGPMVQRVFMERKIWELGLRSRLASVRSLGIPILKVQQNPDNIFPLLKEACEEAVRKDGADVLILSCMALFGVARQLMREIKIPIIDPALAALKMAEATVAIGLTHSAISYPPLSK